MEMKMGSARTAEKAGRVVVSTLSGLRVERAMRKGEVAARLQPNCILGVCMVAVFTFQSCLESVARCLEKCRAKSVSVLSASASVTLTQLVCLSNFLFKESNLIFHLRFFFLLCICAAPTCCWASDGKVYLPTVWWRNDLPRLQLALFPQLPFLIEKP